MTLRKNLAPPPRAVENGKTHKCSTTIDADYLIGAEYSDIHKKIIVTSSAGLDALNFPELTHVAHLELGKFQPSSAMAFSPDGQWLAMIDDNKAVRVYDLSDWLAE